MTSTLDTWFDRLSHRCAQVIDWIAPFGVIGPIRVTELGCVIVVTLSLPGFWSALVPVGVLLALSTAGWLWWLTHWWRDAHGRAYARLSGAAARNALAGMLVVVFASGIGELQPAGGAMMVLIFAGTLAAGAELRAAYGVLVCTAAIIGLEISVLLAGAGLPTAVGLALTPVVALLAGLSRRDRHAMILQAQALFEQTHLTELEQQRAGALAERTRIAREIHDVLAHSLGGLAIQLELAEVLLIEDDDVTGAVARIRQSRELTDRGLVEARRAVRALRADAPPLPEALAALAAQHRDGNSIDFDTSGEPRQLAPEINLAFVRTAQEALFNTRKHAPTHAVDMRLEFTAEETLLIVRDYPATASRVTGPAGVSRAAPARGVGGGYGLAGMRERLALAGGSLVAGPTDDAGGPGWIVTARVPA